MKIGLINVDSKIPNLALMKLSSYHKQKNDEVEFYSPMFHYDKIYCSKVFNYTDDYQYSLNANETELGGSGYNISRKLPEKIENIMPDYDLYGEDYAMGFTTRGCIRNCEFCIVPEKEGKIKAVADIYDFWNGQKKIMLLDNNLTAHKKHFKKIMKQLIKENIKTNFNQGLDIRLITPEEVNLLSKVKLWKQIHFAFDDIANKDEVISGIKVLLDNGLKAYKLMFYVLIGFNSTPEEDMERIKILQKYKIDPFIMPYKNINESNMARIRERCGFKNEYKYKKYLKNFARWVNHKAVYNAVKWEDYKRNNNKVVNGN